MRTVAMNLAGVAEFPAIGSTPYRVDVDGRPYVPVGDGGIVLGVSLGDRVTATAGDHVAPGVSVGHPDPAARFALTAHACVGNPVVVRDGAAAGATGHVIGKRGEDGRVLAWLPEEALAVMVPGDGLSVRASGQGARLDGGPDDVALLNLDPWLLDGLGVQVGRDGVGVGVRAVVPSRLAGNGVGRPAQLWDLDLAFPAGDPVLEGLRLGDLLAVADLDVRHNMGFRRGWLTVGLVVHGDSPMPGHGPGFAPLLTGPAARLEALVDAGGHTGLTLDVLSGGRRGPAEVPAPAPGGRAG
ncbi:DUF4438 domain-containing protein [Microlunatus capsulatus]|uniref:DUF4438 domain-containing protein n=1 Tax=Microlunatus capsulatus TaxID=99117 RepID=A0ABS4Z4T4_9ACTN|nr:DUF4438 domain-containing protein [Microlunatus capsulatus]MBP2415258.1 hypothetical protein [Microlunatus capsulatus]